MEHWLIKKVLLAVLVIQYKKKLIARERERKREIERERERERETERERERERCIYVWLLHKDLSIIHLHLVVI